MGYGEAKNPPRPSPNANAKTPQQPPINFGLPSGAPRGLPWPLRLVLGRGEGRGRPLVLV